MPQAEPGNVPEHPRLVTGLRAVCNHHSHLNDLLIETDSSCDREDQQGTSAKLTNGCA